MLIGVLNLIILISLINLFAKLRREHIEEAEVDALLESRGLVSICRTLFQINHA